MAISLKTAGTWARLAADGTVAIPGTPAAGDRMFLFATWKTYTITVADPSGWTPIGTEFADGAVAAGNGTGSVKVMAWYRDWQSGDAAPNIDWSAAPTEGHAVIMLWTKGGGDSWGTPQTATAAIAAADPFSATSSTTLTIPDGSVVMCLVGLSDDSATIARTTTAISDDGSPALTWNGNYVESPATHFSSTTGLDMSGDLGHRFVTTGAAGVNLVTTGDPAAAETGAAKWIVQGLATPITLTPTTASLVLATFAPSVLISTSYFYATKPIVARLNLAHAGASGLCHCLAFTERSGPRVADLVRPTQPATGYLTTPTWTTGPYGASTITGQGTARGWQLPDHGNLAAGDFAVQIIFSTATLSGDQFLFLKFQNGVGSEFRLSMSSTGVLNYQGFGGTESGISLATGIGSNGLWDFVLTRVAGTCRAYVNGESKGTFSSTGTTAFPAPLYMGADGFGTNLDGQIHAFQIWRRSMSESEVRRLHADPFAHLRARALHLAPLVTTGSHYYRHLLRMRRNVA